MVMKEALNALDDGLLNLIMECHQDHQVLLNAMTSDVPAFRLQLSQAEVMSDVVAEIGVHADSVRIVVVPCDLSLHFDCCHYHCGVKLAMVIDCGPNWTMKQDDSAANRDQAA